MKYDAIVVGGGIAGLTAAAYLAKEGYSTLLLEKEKRCGGLINSFERDGFVFDGGIRATENSGVLFPMLKQLGLEIEFLRNEISIGLEDRVIRVRSEEDIRDYQALLNHFYPESEGEIAAIVEQIKRIMRYMEVQYSIDNPAFLDMKADREYMIKEILPWMLKYAFTAPKISKLNEPAERFLRRFTQNQALLDLITQHFFKQTPAFFALSYLKIYLDYHYPRGGTGRLIEKLVEYIQSHNGTIRNDVRITAVDPQRRILTDSAGEQYAYRGLVWAADLKSLYRFIDLDQVADVRTRTALTRRRAALAGAVGNDSVFTVYLAADLDKSYFAGIASEHFFYTPSRAGESAAGPIPLGQDWDAVQEWLAAHLSLTTYEISIPALRDETLAPPGQTGLVVSILFDYRLTKHIEGLGQYEAFKTFCEERMTAVLDSSIYPGLKDAVLERFSSSPLTIERATANADGAITGWAFSNDPMPAEHRLPKIFSATRTPLKSIAQAGQWTYSPSGLPISILTGKLAADSLVKNLKRER